MRQAIISDVHGNLEALRQVLRKIEAEKCERIICLGDSVGYGPFPDECVELIHRQCSTILMGNHDHALLGLTSTTYFNEYARAALAMTAPLVSGLSKERLAAYPFRADEPDACYVHATPSVPEAWHYLLNRYDVDENWAAFSQPVCFIGHSHRPVVICQTERKSTIFREPADLTLADGYRKIINIGSVGQPRDGNPDACLVVYDTAKKQVDWFRVAYDIAATQEAMQRIGLPEFLIRRLSFGH